VFCLPRSCDATGTIIAVLYPREVVSALQEGDARWSS